MGTPGARKSSSISIAQKALERNGYDRFAADKSSKERFLIDLVGTDTEDEDELLEMTFDNLTSELFVVADEFTDFTGKNNNEFLTTIGKLWDCPPHYKQPKIHGKSVIVPGPTVNILSGNTPDAFHKNMPPEVIGQGAMSRFIFVHGEPTGRKITIPKEPTEEVKKEFSLYLSRISRQVRGAFVLSTEVKALLDRLYREYPEIEDYRFKYYNTRRFTHLIKLSCVFAACRLSMELAVSDCLAANTLLHYTELKMPNALGEFGKARNADVANAVIEIIKTSKKAVTIRYLWKHVAQDLNRQEELQEIVRNLQTAGKLRLVTDPVSKLQGYQTAHENTREWPKDLLLEEFLTEEEKS